LARHCGKTTMTPEAENELVARWMGWEWLGGNVQLWHRDGVHTGSYPDYRTDPALLWELMLKLREQKSGKWSFFPSTPSGKVFAFSLVSDAEVFRGDMAEAVFAAAVMQAQEGK